MGAESVPNPQPLQALMQGEHDRLYSRFKEWLNACVAGHGHEEVGRLLKFMVQYMAEHFALEEELMRTYHYPETQSHTQGHQHIRQEFEKLLKEFESFGATTKLNHLVIYFVFEWLMGHVQGTDKQLETYLLAQSTPGASSSESLGVPPGDPQPAPLNAQQKG